MKEAKTCQNCKNEFAVEADDLGFYKKMGVSAPTFCYVCRRQRRLSWRNDLNLYPRTCGLCNKKVVSIYAENNGMNVYCNTCWWSDDWDPYAYGQDIDFSRPFFEQFRDLQSRVPVLALVNDNGTASKNCEYTQDVAFSKDCYMLFIAWKMENVLYSRYGVSSIDCMDCESIFGGDELLYQSIFVMDSYQSRYLYFSTGCASCAFCYDCKGCTDCFMSIGLRQKKYCFKNEQLTKEEYEQKIAAYQLDTWSGQQCAYAEFQDFIKSFPRKYANLVNCVNCTGNDLVNSKNAHWAFNVLRAEDSKFVENGDTIKDSYDCTIGGECELCYESITPDHNRGAIGTIFSWKNTDIAYTENCHASESIFGCASLKKGSYAILNKRYSKEEYFELREKLIAHMKQRGEWGEFFSSHLSHFGYNETLAQDYYPLIRDEAISQGFRWQDEIRFPTGNSTMNWENVSDSIDGVEPSIIKEILSCQNCSRDYRIVEQEFNLYKKMRVPIPRHCFQCRLAERVRLRNPSYLWGRTTQDNATVMTSYAPDREEKIYSEEGYNGFVNQYGK